jgi:hypothetical protein
MDDMTKNITPRYIGKDRTAAAVFSHRVNGSQNDPERIEGMLKAVEGSKFKKVFFVTTDLLNTYTLPSPKKTAEIPDPEAYVRVQAFNYLVNFLKDNAKFILSLKIEFDFLPFYQIRYSDKRLKKTLRELFIKPGTAERYTLEKVLENISVWAAVTETLLKGNDLVKSSEYDEAFDKNKELYGDEGSYKTAVDNLAKQHENDEPTWTKDKNKDASRQYQFGEGVLNKHLAKCNKESKGEKEFDCLLYSGGEISLSLKYIEKHKIRSKFRLEQVVYNDETKQIETVRPASPKSTSGGRSSGSEEESAEGTDTYSSQSGTTSTLTSASGSVESPQGGSLAGSPSDTPAIVLPVVPPSVAAGEPKKAAHAFSLGRKKPNTTQGRGMFDGGRLTEQLRETMGVASEFGDRPGYTFEATIEDVQQGKKATARATVPPAPAAFGNKK